MRCVCWSQNIPTPTGPPGQGDGMTATTITGLSEAASEKTRRGRPTVWSDEIMDSHRPFIPVEVKSRRGRMNVMYRIQALQRLPDDPEFAWLADRPRMEAGEPHSWKPSLLTELGRIPWDDVLA